MNTFYIIFIFLFLFWIFNYLTQKNLKNKENFNNLKKNISCKSIDYSKYILKSKIPTQHNPIDKSKYILKSKIPACPKCPNCSKNLKKKNGKQNKEYIIENNLIKKLKFLKQNKNLKQNKKLNAKEFKKNNEIPINILNALIKATTTIKDFYPSLKKYDIELNKTK